MGEVGLLRWLIEPVVNGLEHILEMFGFGVLAPDVVLVVERVDQIELHHRVLQSLLYVLLYIFVVMGLTRLNIKLELKVEAVVESYMNEEFPHVLGRHALDNRADHQEKSICFEPSSLRVVESEVPAHGEKDEEERLDFWEP